VCVLRSWLDLVGGRRSNRVPWVNRWPFLLFFFSRCSITDAKFRGIFFYLGGVAMIALVPKPSFVRARMNLFSFVSL
jgi:hypothetical protein